MEVPSGDDALALLEERAIRLENVEIEGALGDQPTPEQIFAQLCEDERSATTVKGKRRVQLKRLGADPDMLSNRLVLTWKDPSKALIRRLQRRTTTTGLAFCP